MAHRVRLLIADNSRDFVWLLVQFLSRFPEIEIIGIAYDGRQAIEMVRQTQPDILLLDLVMPGMNGIEALQEIRRENGSVRIFIMSALELNRLKESAEELGIEQYYVKPFDFDAVIQAIRSRALG